jgi:hypothetical protein
MIARLPVWLEVALPPQARFPGGSLSADVVVIGSGASGRPTGLLGPGVGKSLAGLARRHGPARAQAFYCATLRALGDNDVISI